MKVKQKHATSFMNTSGQPTEPVSVLAMSMDNNNNKVMVQGIITFTCAAKSLRITLAYKCEVKTKERKTDVINKTKETSWCQ